MYDNGHPQEGGPYYHGFYVTWTCMDRYELTTTDTHSYCVAGVWNGTLPVCTGKGFGGMAIHLRK